MIREIEYTGVFDITKYVDQYNDKIGWTEAFRQAISDAEKAGGGVIYVPPGKYSTFSIQLKSNMTVL